MSPETWHRLTLLFEQAVHLDSSERNAFLARLDPRIAEILHSLLESDAAGASRIEQTIQAVADGGAVWTGRRLGSWVLDREIGRGGMGVVFEAHRADDQFRKRAAIKVATRAPFSRAFGDRFRAERQMLAVLEHPNIARLLDGGETPEGLPYFAMEFVEGGLPVDEYCERHNLPLERRLALFLAICDAVAFAHRNLIVHRDIKPANVLVDSSGAPKLLDFGIAKLIAPEQPSAPATATGFAPVTPEYCSPEQIRSLATTTRTDVYLLGLLLYELLCNVRAQQVDSTSLLSIDRAICETDPPPPSRRAAENGAHLLARRLQGDLDAIVGKAIAKDAAHRYASAEHLADDLNRYLRNEPIVARPQSWWYRFRKTAARYRAAVAAAAIVTCTLIGATVFSARQAALANRRFEQVRGIARALLYDVHDQIRNLPDSNQAQQTVVETARAYLDSLSLEAAGDAKLLLDIGSGYTRLGVIQSGSMTGGLGDREQGIANLRKANRILETALRNEPANPNVVKALADARVSLAEELVRAGQAKEALDAIQSGLALVEPALKRSPASIDANRGYAHLCMVMARDFSEPSNAIQLAQDLSAALAPIEAAAVTQPAILQELAIGHSVAGGLYFRAKQHQQALTLLSRSLDWNQRVVAASPENAAYRRGLMLAHSKAGDVYLALKDRANAIKNYQAMVEQARWRIAKEPSSKTARMDFAMSSIRSADAFEPSDPQALAAVRRGVASLEELAASSPGDTGVRRNLADAYVRLAARLIDTGDQASARRLIDKELAAMDAALQREPGQLWFQQTKARLLREKDRSRP